MKLNRKVYETRAEKQKDFAIGVGVFIGLNALLGFLLWIVGSLLTEPFVNSTSEVVSALALLGVFLFNALPFVINLGVLIYFLVTRIWIAFGMLGAFGALLLLGLIAGIILSIVCFTTMGSGL